MNTNLPVGPVHYAQDPLPLITSKHSTEMCHTSESCVLFTKPTNLFFSATFFLLKMSPIALFTHLKIILLQYFQFSIFSQISDIQMYP